MRIDRLYAITIHLLNHGKTSGRELSERFEVSQRTILRDMDTLCQAGIPIRALPGASGGYEIMSAFQMERHTATQEDYALIRTALRGLATATGSPKVQATLEKIASITTSANEPILLDFSVLREGDQALLKTLEAAIREKRAVQFTYTNADNITRVHTVEPIAVIYRWYAWYLLAYSTAKGDYRTYKLIRMRDVCVTEAAFTREHECAQTILQQSDRAGAPTTAKITVRCKAEARTRAVEYLNGMIEKEFENGDLLMTLHVVENELFWFGALLSLGDTVEVLEPEHLRNRIRSAAKNLVSLYENHDTLLS